MVLFCSGELMNYFMIIAVSKPKIPDSFLTDSCHGTKHNTYFLIWLYESAKSPIIDILVMLTVYLIERKGYAMGLFSNILEKLGLKKPAEVTTAPKASAGDSRPAPTVTTTAKTTVTAQPGVVYPEIHQTSEIKAPVAKIEVVDVMSKLEKMATANPQKLNWKTSIVDLLKLLGLDSSLAARKELATELGCPAEKMGGDYAEMNVWLQKTVLQKIADNGGNIPQDLLK